MPPKSRSKGKGREVSFPAEFAAPEAAHDGPARRTRATTKSPQKPGPTKTPINSRPGKRAIRPLPKRKAAALPPIGEAPHSVPIVDLPPPADSADEISGEEDDDNPMTSPHKVPFRIRRPVIIPDNLVGYSQARSDEEFIEGSPILSPDARDARKRFVERDYIISSESDDNERTRSYDDENAATGLNLPFLNDDIAMDVELFQSNDGIADGYLDLTPIFQAARTIQRTAVPSSPIAARAARQGALLSRLMQIPAHQNHTEDEVEAATITNAAHDVLDAHRAKRRRKGPTTAKLAAAVSRMDPPGNPAPDLPLRRQPAPTRANAGPSGPSTRPAPSNYPNAVVGPSKTNYPGRHPVDARAPIATFLANAARQPDPDDEGLEQMPDTRKRKRASVPAPHHLHARTPNTRIILRKGKEDYAFRIMTVNAYPDAHGRVVSAKEAHDWALQAAPDAAAMATGANWSPTKVRTYGETGWVSRGALKNCASNNVPTSYRLSIPPALAETLVGGVDAKNTAAFIKSRVSYLFDKGGWLRGRHAGHISMLYAHPIFPVVVEQAIYRPATAERRAMLSPFPIPSLALVATAVQCALEEWQTGIRIRISFTEEMYSRVYRLHLKRLIRMSTSHKVLLNTLLEYYYDYCVARNEAQPVQHPELEDEVDELDVLNSDEEYAADVADDDLPALANYDD